MTAAQGKSPEALGQVEDKAQQRRGSIENEHECLPISDESCLCSPGSWSGTRDNCSLSIEVERHKGPQTGPPVFHSRCLHESKDYLICSLCLPTAWHVTDTQ